MVGIVAGRLKDRLHRPTFVFAAEADGLLKGSGRSIPGFHLRDALDLVTKRHPGLLRRFGGHSMAAGCTIEAENFGTFAEALRSVAEAGARRDLVRADRAGGRAGAAGLPAFTQGDCMKVLLDKGAKKSALNQA